MTYGPINDFLDRMVVRQKVEDTGLYYIEGAAARLGGATPTSVSGSPTISGGVTAASVTLDVPNDRMEARIEGSNGTVEFFLHGPTTPTPRVERRIKVWVEEQEF